MAGLLQKPIEGETSFVEAQDEAVERDEAPCNSLYPLYVLNQAHPHDGRDLLWVGLDAMLGDDETEQHAPWDPKMHFSGLSLMPFAWSFMKVGYRSTMNW